MDRELAAAQRRQGGPPIRTGQRPALGAGDVAAGIGELEQERRRHARAVDRQHDAELRRRCLEARDQADDRRLHVAAVVEHRERQCEQLDRFADCEPVLAGLAERPPPSLRERLAAEARERLRRAEPGRGAADEQDARQPWTRHASL